MVVEMPGIGAGIPVGEGALRLRMRRDAVARLVQAGQLRGARVDGRWFVSLRDVEALEKKIGPFHGLQPDSTLIRPPDLIRSKEAAALVSAPGSGRPAVSAWSLRAGARRGQVPPELYVRLGGRLYWRRTALLAYFSNLSAGNSRAVPKAKRTRRAERHG
jgi:hypothetical protein